LIKIIIKEENFKWHLEAFASELFIYTPVFLFFVEFCPYTDVLLLCLVLVPVFNLFCYYIN